MQTNELVEQVTLFDLDLWFGKMCPEPSPVEIQRGRTSASSSRRSAELKAIPYMFLDLMGPGDLLGLLYWETLSPWRGVASTLNTGVSPREERGSSLSQILEVSPHPKYFLSPRACLGILRRSQERGKELPPQLKMALMAQAGLAPVEAATGGLKAYHINQRDEGIDLGEVSGALMATTNLQMQTFVTGEPIGFDGYNGDLTDGVSATLGTNCGMSTGRNGVIAPIAFATNQRDEVRDLHDVAGAICASQTIKQQTLIKESCLTPWDTQQKRIFLPDGVSPTLAGADGGGGRNPGGLLLAAFSAGAGASAGGIGYSEEIAPTLKGSQSGNCMPSLLCLNDQGGSVMECTEDVAGTLRAQEHGHQPLVLASQQGGAELGVDLCPTITAAAGLSGNNQPVLFENHGIDSRYTGPHKVSPTISARAGTGGNNLPLVAGEEASDAQKVFSRQRVDVFKAGEVVSTESARQHKDATDLVYQGEVDDSTDEDSLCANQDAPAVETPLLIRRLTPLECERLQGFPDGWTDIPGASDSSRYKALGNSVAIPCVEFIMGGIAAALRADELDM